MKIGSLPIILIGVAVALIVSAFGYFIYWDPNMAAVAQWKVTAEKAEAEAAKLPQAKNRLKTAQAMVQERADEWQKVVAAKTPPESEVNLAQHPWQLTVDVYHYRNRLQQKLNNQVKNGGVEVLSGPAVPETTTEAAQIVSDFFNYPAIPFPVVIVDFGPVQVRGTYEQIMANVRSWTNMPNYLAVADGLSISGTAPSLTGTYNLTLVGYIRGKAIYPAIPVGTAPPPATTTAVTK